MPQDGEELMVIMLGMSTVECPGMLPEEKVLGKRIIPRRNTLSPPPKDARPTSLRTHAVPQRNSHSSDNGDNDDSTDDDDIAIELEKSATTQELSESLKASDSSQLTSELPELPQEAVLLQPSSNTQNIDFQLISHTDSFGPDVTPFQPHSTSLIQTQPLDISLQKEGDDQFQLISETGDSLSPSLGLLQARSTSPVIQAQPLNFIESPVYERNTSPCPFSLDQNSSATLSPCPFSPVKDAPPSPLLSGSSTSTAPLGTLIDFADSSEEFTSGSFSPTMNAFSHLVGSPPFPTDVKRDSRDSAFSSYSILSEPNSRDSIGSMSSGITADSVSSSVTLLANRGSLSSSGSSASELRGNQVSSSGGSAGEGKQKNKPLEDIEENKKGDSLKMNSKGGPIISKIGISRRKASSYKLKSPTKDNEQEKQKPRSTLGSKILNMKWGRKEERRTRKKDGVQVYNMLTDDVLETFMAVIPHDQAPEKTAKEISDGIIQKYKMMGRRSAPEPAQAKSETDALQSTADIMYTLEDAKCRLRQVLCCADFHNLSWMTASARTPTPHNQEEAGQTELMTFLQSQFAETINLHDRSLAVKLQETIRCIKQIPPDSYSKVIRMLEDDYKARAPYISYLIRSRQGLLLTQAHLDKLTERVERDIFICRKYFTSVCVRLFLEQRESKIVDLCRRFQDLTISDEKATIIRDFLDELLNDIASDPIWRDSSEDQRYELEVATERVIFNKIYKNALYPLGDSDRLRDQMYYTHTALLAKAVGVRHKALDIPEIYCKEAPWPSAQTELLAINAYKTPTDKLKCIQRCCTTIMNLLSMANELSVPGADDFVPVLVFVVIQANPPNLLSTIEYVNNFYGERLSGEESYCWMQFCAATQFVKSMLMKFGTG